MSVLPNGAVIRNCDEAFETYYISRTYRIRVGCGNLYITVDYNKDGTFHKIRIPRNTKFSCSLITRDTLAKDATYKTRRDPKQLIKDLKGNLAHACERYCVICKAYSCSDAVAQVVKEEFKSEISQ